jgi:nicotinate phosphoribosyltransferase
MPYSPRPEDYEEVLINDRTAMWGDLYALTMWQALYTSGRKDKTLVTMGAFIRKEPMKGSYLAMAGQNVTLEWMDKKWRFIDKNIRWMRKQIQKDPETGEMKPLFTEDFIDHVKNRMFDLSVEVMDGVAFAYEDLYAITGEFGPSLMVETPILNITNSQALRATVAARLKEATGAQLLLEFGLRRAPDIGGQASTRGLFAGGFDATSNIEAAQNYAIPAAGTFAHALVMLYEEEIEAFADYIKAMPYNGIFLVDTYDTIEGVKKAVEACKRTGTKLKGIRLDSGDLVELSIAARKILDEAGFTNAKIAASNDLDEKEVLRLKKAGAKIDIWGIGTNAVACTAQPALGAVYKLEAIYGQNETTETLLEYVEILQKAVQSGDTSPEALGKFVRDVVKLGEKNQATGIHEKATIPGKKLTIRTMFNDALAGWQFDGDILYPAWEELPVRMIENPEGPYQGVLTKDIVAIPQNKPEEARTFKAGTFVTLPLRKAFTAGVLTGTIGTVHDERAAIKRDLELLPKKYRDLENPERYFVGLAESLYNKHQNMMASHSSGPK